MDSLQLLSDLEGLRDKIPARWLGGDFEGLIGLLTEVAAVVLSLMWEALPTALLAGLASIAAIIGIILLAESNSKANGGSGDAAKPSKKACQKATKLMEQVDRLVQKTGGKINPKRLAEIKKKLADGTLTSDDLPGSLQSEFPGELKGLTYQEIQNRCKGV